MADHSFKVNSFEALEYIAFNNHNY